MARGFAGRSPWSLPDAPSLPALSALSVGSQGASGASLRGGASPQSSLFPCPRSVDGLTSPSLHSVPPSPDSSPSCFAVWLQQALFIPQRVSDPVCIRGS